MNKIYFILIFFLACLKTHAQSVISIEADQLRDKTIAGGAAQSELVYSQINGPSLHFLIQPSHLFSCFGIGWQSSDYNLNNSVFSVRYRTKQRNGNWSEWKTTEAEFTPAENPKLMYWTDATFTFDAESHQMLELIVSTPGTVRSVSVDMFDGNFDRDNYNNISNGQNKMMPNGCPAFPTIIARSQWCGGSASCTQVNTAYTPTYISPTHVVIHHGASPDTYTSGAAVVQSYYNYHVNTLGWTDIGYNFLVDKFGNFFQGRHNPNLTSSDVRGAHAGNANSGSIGINFPGNADVTIATPVQLDVVNRLLAWWFDRTGFDPTTSASMTTQAYGVQTQPRICGHKDIGQTSCPGTDLYARIPGMRTSAKRIIDSCNSCVAPSTLSATNITSSTAVLNWNVVSNATGYNIQYKASSSLSWTTVSTTVNSLTVSGLSASTVYAFKVQPVCSGSAASYSRESTFSTLAACNPTTNLTSTSVASTSASISWSAVSGAVSYQYEYKTAAATSWTIATTTATTASLSGLAASTTYNFRVRTNCSSNTSIYSSTASFTTTAPPCNASTTLSSSNISSNAASISWSAVSGAVSYQYEYKTTAATIWTVATTTVTTASLTGLTASTSYNFRVRTNCATNTSVYSSTSSFTTLAPPCNTPTSLSVTSISTTAATLNWGAVSGAVSYNIQYRVTGATSWTSTTSTTNSKALAGLQHSTSYQYQIQTVCTSNSSAFSSVATFTTTTPPDQNLIIGSGTTAYSGHPFATGFSDERTQYIFTAAELAAAGWTATNPYLKTISIQVSTAATQVMNAFTITFSHTTSASFANSNYLTGTGTTATYSGNVTAVTGWNNYTLTTPFAYNGTQNLLVTICWNNSTFTSNSIVPTTILPTYQALFNRSNLATSGLCTTTTGTLSYYRPNFKFTFRALNLRPVHDDDNLLELTEGKFIANEEIISEVSAPYVTESEDNMNLKSIVTDLKNDFTVYPNPFNNKLFVVISDNNEMSVNICVSNILGAVVYKYELNNNSQEIDLSALEKGIYFITIGNKTKQIVKVE